MSPPEAAFGAGAFAAAGAGADPAGRAAPGGGFMAAICLAM